MSEPKKSPSQSYFFLFKNGKTQFDFLILLAKNSFQVFVLYPEANYPAVSGLCQFVFLFCSFCGEEGWNLMKKPPRVCACCFVAGLSTKKLNFVPPFFSSFSHEMLHCDIT